MVEYLDIVHLILCIDICAVPPLGAQPPRGAPPGIDLRKSTLQLWGAGLI